MSATENSFLALILDFDGRITESVQASQLANHFPVGSYLFHHLVSDSLPRFLDYLSETLEQGYSFGGELCFKTPKETILFGISLLKIEQRIVLISLKERQETLSVLNEIIRINNEQLNALRSAKALNGQTNDDATHIYLQELTTLNSELVNTQRQLAQKNAELNTLNQKLRIMSMHDALTKIRNRRCFFSDAPVLSKVQPLRLIMLDLNNFKDVNDKHGHHQGDEVLRHFAAYLETHTNALHGHAYRLGGDEFAMIIPASTVFPINQWTAEINTYLQTLDTAVSVAYGIAILPVESTLSTIEKALIDADQDMYRQKKKARG